MSDTKWYREQASAAVDLILKDLKGRSGFDWMFDSSTKEILKEIKRTWVKIIAEKFDV